MKKKWLILIVIVVLICLILIFLPQLFVKYVIERPLENIIGAKVVVHGLKFDLFKLGFNLGGIEIANPKDTWRNLFETKGIYFRLEGKPLLSGMIVVENVGIDQLRVDTPRKTDGKLDRPIPPMSLAAAITNLEQSIPPVPVLSSDLLNHPPNVNNLINAHRFLIDSTAESIHSDLQTKKEELRKQITSGAESINEKANYIKGEYNRIIGLTLTPQQQIESLNNLKRTIPAVKNLIDTQRSSIEREIDSFKDQIDGLGRQAEADIRAIQAKVGLPNLDVDLSKALFGKLLLDQSIPYIELGERLRKLKFYQPPNPNIPIEKPNFPKFVIKKVTLSAGGSPGTVTEGYWTTGSAEWITNDPTAYGNPLTASLAGSNSQGTTLTGGIRLTHLTPQFDDTLTLKLSKLKTPSPLSGESLPWEDNPYLPPVITIGSLSMEGNLNIQPDGLALRLKFSAASIDSNYNGSGKYTDEVMRVIRELLDRIQSVDLELSLKERVSNLTMNINSNIGAQIRTSIENLLTSGLKEFNKELQRKVNERKNQTEKELTKFQNEDCRKLLIAEANRIESELTRVEGFIDSKIKGLRDAIDSGADTVRDAVDAGADTARDAVDNGADAVRDIFR